MATTLRALALGAAASIGLASAAADAAVICQKDARVKFRADACRPGWTELARVGGAGDPSGVWEVTGGTLFDSSRLVARFLVLEPDGGGRLNLTYGEGGVLNCTTLNYARALTPVLTLELANLGYLPTKVVRYALEGAETLQLIGADGRTATLARVDAIPPEADCGTLQEITLFAGLPIPESFSGLPFDGTQLWYELQNGEEIVPVDPGTGAIGAPREFGSGQFTHVHASAGQGFWTHCGCGGSTEAGLVSGINTLIDEVRTGEELGEELGVRAIAYDESTGTLWLHGWSRGDYGGRLFRVDPFGAEPDDLVAASDLDGNLSGLAYDGTNLWAVDRSGQSVVRIDPVSGTATGNFQIPNRYAWWYGIAVVGGELALLGDTGLEGAILKVALPAP